MQINKDRLDKKEGKIVIDYNPNSPKNKWLQKLIDNSPNMTTPPKKNLGKAK